MTCNRKQRPEVRTANDHEELHISVCVCVTVCVLILLQLILNFQKYGVCNLEMEFQKIKKF